MFDAVVVGGAVVLWVELRRWVEFSLKKKKKVIV